MRIGSNNEMRHVRGGELQVGLSGQDLIAKMGIVEEEADESAHWVELLVESNIVRQELVAALLGESRQLAAITVSSIETARERK
jgi:four helix bundle protein